MPLLTQNGFRGPGMPNLTTSFRWFHLHSLCGATLLGSHQCHLPPTVWHSLLAFRLLTSVCRVWQRDRTQNLQRVLGNSGPILTRLWTKVDVILERCWRPSYFPTPLPDCLRHVLFRRHSPFSLKVVEQELIMDEIPERDVTYHLTCLLIYHGTTTHLYSCFIFFLSK